MADESTYTIKYRGFSKLYTNEIEFSLGQTYSSVEGAELFLKTIGVDTEEGNHEFWIKRDKLYMIDETEDLRYAFGRIIKI